MAEPLFSVKGLHLALPDMTRKPLFGPAPRIEILKGLSFDLPAGEITGIVGESGSGKSTLGRVLVRLLGATAGQVLFRGKDLSRLDEAQIKPLRRDLQMIFQDPMSSLNPRHTVGHIVASPIKRYGIDEPGKRALAALERVGLSTAFAK
ncbi:MAG: ATP-binding cassette domain-containing protein [Pusillimonas sp.]|nr:ATP-binding cassette domain-containing protein [Pusillimonas sp.]